MDTFFVKNVAPGGAAASAGLCEGVFLLDFICIYINIYICMCACVYGQGLRKDFSEGPLVLGHLY